MKNNNFVDNEEIFAFNLLRFITAFLVCISHLRNFIFEDYYLLVNPNLFDQFFYYTTGLGHQCVIIFFVLSGYFVGGKLLINSSTDIFSVGKYLFKRLTRLWVVLIPALFFTFILDNIGIYLTNGNGYINNALILSAHQAPEKLIDLSFNSFIGNILFLQTIVTNIFGTNMPLWSLANEFWYYIFFPIIIFSLKGYLINALLVVVLLIYAFPDSIIYGFINWIIGCLTFVIIYRGLLKPNYLIKIILVLIFFITLIYSKYIANYFGDFVLSVGCSLFMIAIFGVNIKYNKIKILIKFLSDCSFTIYLFHFTFIAFITYLINIQHAYKPGLIGYSIFLLFLILTICYCLICWSLFERHTNSIRFFIINKVLNK